MEGDPHIFFINFWMPSRIEVMVKLRGTDTIGFNINPIDRIIKPRESAVKTTAKKAKNNASSGTKHISACFQSWIEENFGTKFSFRRDCLWKEKINRLYLGWPSDNSIYKFHFWLEYKAKSFLCKFQSNTNKKPKCYCSALVFWFLIVCNAVKNM